MLQKNFTRLDIRILTLENNISTFKKIFLNFLGFLQTFLQYKMLYK